MLVVHGFVDADWARDLNYRRFTSGYMFNVFGGIISLMNKKQVVAALSTIEVEYMESTHVSKKALWLQIFCSNIGFEQQFVRLDCDSQSSIFPQRTLLITLKQSILMCSIICERHGWKQGVARESWHFGECCRFIDKFVSIEKFSWCREAMEFFFPWLLIWYNPITHVCKENDNWENVGCVLYSLHGDFTLSYTNHVRFTCVEHVGRPWGPPLSKINK